MKEPANFFMAGLLFGRDDAIYEHVARVDESLGAPQMAVRIAISDRPNKKLTLASSSVNCATSKRGAGHKAGKTRVPSR